jgi:hypothetical protein
MIARHRVAAAADLAALAAAGVLAGWQPTGAGAVDEATTVGSSACARAVEVGTANGGRIVGCTVTASSVQVVAELATHGLITMLPPGAVVTATARAGFS